MRQNKRPFAEKVVKRGVIGGDWERQQLFDAVCEMAWHLRRAR